jgi:hypothetical protein
MGMFYHLSYVGQYITNSFVIKKKHHNSSQELTQHLNVSFFWHGCSSALKFDQKLVLQGRTQK